MIPAEMVLGFLSSAKASGRKVKLSGGDHGAKKGLITDLKMENKVITVDVEGEVFVLDMNVLEAKTSIFDHRVIYLRGEDQYKIQLG